MYIIRTSLWGRNGSIIKFFNFPEARPICWSFPKRSRIHCLAPEKSVFTLIKPNLPRRLIN